MKKIFKDGIFVLLAIVGTTGITYGLKPITKESLRQNTVEAARQEPVATAAEQAPVEEVKPAEEPPSPVVAPTPPPAPVEPPKPAPKPQVAGSGSCEAEIAKYDWNQSVAIAVSRAESGLHPGKVNNNPRTKDYSIGCFQINIYGANAKSRPSEAALKNAATNVAFAHKIYKSNGSSFKGQWGVCRSKVSCY